MEIPKGFATNRVASLYGEAARTVPGPAAVAAPYNSLAKGLEDAGNSLGSVAIQEQKKVTEDTYAAQTAEVQAKLATSIAEEMATINTRTDLIPPEDLNAARERVLASVADLPMPPRLKASIGSVVKEHMASLLPQVAKRNASIAEASAIATSVDQTATALANHDYALARTQIGIAEANPSFPRAQLATMKKAVVGSEGASNVMDAYVKGGLEAANKAALAVLDTKEIPESEARVISGRLHALAESLDLEAHTAQVKASYDIRSRILNGVPDENGQLQYLHRADVEPLLKRHMFEPEQEFMIREALRTQEAGDAAEAKRLVPFNDAMVNGDKTAAARDPSAKAHAADYAAANLPNMVEHPITQWAPEDTAQLSHMIEVNYTPPQVAMTLETGQTSNTLSDTQAGFEMANFLAQRHPNLYGSMPPSQVAFYDALRTQTQAGMVSTDAVTTLREQSRELAKNKPALDMMWAKEKINKADLDGTLLNNLQSDPAFRDVSLSDAVLTPEVRQLNYMLVRQQFDLNGGNLKAAQTSAAFVLRNSVRLSKFNGTPEMMTTAPESYGTSQLPEGVLQAQLQDVIATQPIASQPPPRTPGLMESITGTPNIDYRAVPADTYDGKGAPVFAIYYRANNMPVMLKNGEQLHWAPDYEAAQKVAQAPASAAISAEKARHDYVVSKLAADPNWNPVGPDLVNMYQQVKAEQSARR